MRRTKRILVSVTILLASCIAGEQPRGPAEEPPIGPAADPAVRVDGSCASAHPIDAEGLPSEESARPPGDLGAYRTPLWIEERRVRVRANAMWPGGDHRNVIGTIAGRTWVLGEGPLEDAELGAGIGYAIVVEDGSGARCRGYLSLTVARPRA